MLDCWHFDPLLKCVCLILPIANGLWHGLWSYCLLPFAYCLLLIAYGLWPVACGLWPIAYCLLSIFYQCLTPIAYCLLPIAVAVAYCLLPIAYGLWLMAYCLLPVHLLAVQQAHGSSAVTWGPRATLYGFNIWSKSRSIGKQHNWSVVKYFIQCIMMNIKNRTFQIWNSF